MRNETGATDNAAENASEINERLSLLRDAANKFASRDIHLKRARQLRGTSPGYDRQVWREMAELGWLGLLQPERFGGSGLGCAEMAVVTEVLGRSLFPEPVVAATILAGGAVLYGDNDALKAELLPALAKGEMIPALAWREEGHVCDIFAIDTRADDTSNGVKISGTKRLIVGGASADGFIVSARGRRGVGLYWVPSGAVVSGLSTVELADGRLAAELTLAGVEVPISHRIAEAGTAEAALLRAYDEALIMTAAELLGVLSKAFEITLDYLRTRVQFGRPIGSFQALQHRAADMYIAQRVCRHTLDAVIARVDTQGLTAEARGALASRIKARCSEASLRIAREAIQMHGAIGFTDECDVGLFVKRAITLSGWLGGAEVHRRRFARLAPHETQD